MRKMPIRKAAELLDLTDTQHCRQLQCHVVAVRKEADSSYVTCVGVDAMAIREGHRNISVFADLLEQWVFFAEAGKDAGV